VQVEDPTIAEYTRLKNKLLLTATPTAVGKTSKPNGHADNGLTEASGDVRGDGKSSGKASDKGGKKLQFVIDTGAGIDMDELLKDPDVTDFDFTQQLHDLTKRLTDSHQESSKLRGESDRLRQQLRDAESALGERNTQVLTVLIPY